MSARSNGAHRAMLGLAFLLGSLLLLGLWQAQSSVGSDEEAVPGPVSGDFTKRQAARAEAKAEDYWTPQKMQNATPMDAAVVVDTDDSDAQAASGEPLGPPEVFPGSPGGEAGKGATRGVTSSKDSIAEPQHGSAPTNPLSGTYGPFQRWSATGKYTTYPLRTIGKLFFTLNGGGFVCSATTIGDNEIITAGHCMSDNPSILATNVTFCPAYNAGGANPAYGCWDNWNGWVTSGPWFNNGDPDYDYATLRFGNDGNCNCLVGNAVGWMGYGWNWGTAQPDMAFGYPQAAPFAGNRLIQVASSDWYTWAYTSGGQTSKVMGNDMTGGSSGGPWVLGFKHENAEIADTDNSNATDPLGSTGPWVNGVNSHKRCTGSCFTPPTTTQGTFWQEMSSPPFEDTTDGNDVQTIIDLQT